jgi:hypothetical protein
MVEAAVTMERYRTTLILLGALILLVVAWLFLRNNAPAGTDATPTATPTVYVWQEPGDVNSIDVVSDTTTVSVRKDLSTTVWSLTAPIQATADEYQVSAQADSLKNLVAMATLTNTTDLKQYGLDSSKLTFKFTTAGSSPANHTVKVGKATIDGAGYYIKADDKAPVYVVSNSMVEALKSWITTPPKAQPTATPVPTQPPTPAASTTITATGTITLTLPGTPTSGLSNTATITSTSPGGANSTTPAASPTP